MLCLIAIKKSLTLLLFQTNDQFPYSWPPSSMHLHNWPTLQGKSTRGTMCSVNGSSLYCLSAEITLFICPRTIQSCLIGSGANYLLLSRCFIVILECHKYCKRCPTLPDPFINFENLRNTFLALTDALAVAFSLSNWCADLFAVLFADVNNYLNWIAKFIGHMNSTFKKKKKSAIRWKSAC